MFLSVFELFKIGVGPSSSHTVGPMVAAQRFLSSVSANCPGKTGRVQIRLHGSLAYTGEGHGTDRALILGLAGEKPDTVDPARMDDIVAAVKGDKTIDAGGVTLAFDPDQDIVFDYGPPLPGHANGMAFSLVGEDGASLYARVYYSVGGGFVVSGEELDGLGEDQSPVTHETSVPYPFASAREMLDMGARSGHSIADMKMANESARRPEEDIIDGLDRIWATMSGCIERGLARTGVLPGGLNVRRRAREIHAQLLGEAYANDRFAHTVMDWLGVYAMAVNEENAAGGQVVTAPTNGAAGVIPAVIRYYLDHCNGADQAGVRTFLLTAAAVGGIIKHNASISGAEVGCQGEVGSAAAMAAAGLTAVLGGTNMQIENAAEIALEHHLGMTCDPIKGLVQVPCIERNALGAVKAVTASSLALRGDGTHFVPLDHCIETMRQTGIDMSEKYKETSTGGLAASVIEC
ncbi:MAG: L-serine ammonia-lyase [Hyphomicrobiales bacterium]|nr:MAG: L-serine ammonia-lyase [Hyphomicrobiales bacterium]